MTEILRLPLVRMDVASSYDADLRCSFFLTLETFPLDLTGIDYKLNVWRRNMQTGEEHEILLAATATGGELQVVYNQFSISIPVTRMEHIPFGSWPFEIIATAEGATVEFVLGTLVHGPDGGSLITSLSAEARFPAEGSSPGVGGSGLAGPPAWQTPPVPWSPNSTYVATAPASLVTANGATWVCAVSHVSSSQFSSDFNAGYWVLIAEAGAGGGGEFSAEWSAILHTPTTLDGYGITDAERLANKGQPLGYAPLGVDGIVPANHLPEGGAVSLDWSNISGRPTTLTGYGIVDAERLANKGVASGYAPLDAASKVPLAHMPITGAPIPTALERAFPLLAKGDLTPGWGGDNADFGGDKSKFRIWAAPAYGKTCMLQDYGIKTGMSPGVSNAAILAGIFAQATVGDRFILPNSGQRIFTGYAGETPGPGSYWVAFDSKPPKIPRGCSLEGNGNSASSSFVIRLYGRPNSLEPFIDFDYEAATARNFTIYTGAGFQGGTAVGLIAKQYNINDPIGSGAGSFNMHPTIERVNVSYSGNGNWKCCYLMDGTLATAKGIREPRIINCAGWGFTYVGLFISGCVSPYAHGITLTPSNALVAYPSGSLYVYIGGVSNTPTYGAIVSCGQVYALLMEYCHFCTVIGPVQDRCDFWAEAVSNLVISPQYVQPLSNSGVGRGNVVISRNYIWSDYGIAASVGAPADF